VKRVPLRSRPRNTGPDPATVAIVRERDAYRCVRCDVPCIGERGWQWSIHHRRGRDGKPDSNLPQNLLTVCGADNVTGCHGFIESHRAEGRDNGWRIDRNGVATDPLLIPVLVCHGSRWVYLTADGRYSDDPEVPDAA
jgi:hypothetical protein